MKYISRSLIGVALSAVIAHLCWGIMLVLSHSPTGIGSTYGWFMIASVPPGFIAGLTGCPLWSSLTGTLLAAYVWALGRFEQSDLSRLLVAEILTGLGFLLSKVTAVIKKAKNEHF